MTTDLPPGAVFVVREHGSYRLYVVCENGSHFTGVRRPLLFGEVVHFAVWRDHGKRLEIRKSYVLKQGDAIWCDSGVKELDLTKPPSAEFGYAETGKMIWVNRFAGGPVWLREAH